MSDWKKYYDVDVIRRLPCEGRELLGQDIYITEKRDGSNVSIRLTEKDKKDRWSWAISSHNMEVAAPDIQNVLKETMEFGIALVMLADETNYENHYIVYGELICKGRGPTRVEPAHKYAQWIIFDIWDIAQQRYLTYNELYQKCYHWKLPVIKLLGIERPMSMEDIGLIESKWLKWCKHHRREGIVGKVYSPRPVGGFVPHEQVMFKTKIDLPDLKPKLRTKKEEVQLPQMPEDRIRRAMLHAYDTVTNFGTEEANWKDRSKAMPEIAKQITTEAREHAFRPPNNFYQIYLMTPIEQLRPVILGSATQTL